jgi:Histidine kinase-, DNA gyrase B-, and HSP90-like ATPase
MIEQLQCNITPTTDIIHGDRNARDLSLPKALAEPVDNSLDAGASIVQIDINGGWLSIADDGRGCDDPEAMLRLGRHVASADHTIGRYGIGLKRAAIWLSRITNIVSSTGRRMIKVIADWDAIAAKGDWSIAATRDECDSDPFTEISFEVFGNRANPRAMRAARDFLADVFSPAIDSGRKLYFDGEELQSVKIPELEDPITHVGVFQGKPYHLTAGLLPVASARCGYRIAFRHRILEDRVARGCGEYNPSRFFAYLVLDESDRNNRWHLDQYKHGFEERDDLLDELFPVVERLLKESQERSREVEIAGLTEDVELSLQAALGPVLVNARRPGVRGRRGGVKPTTTGGEHGQTEHPGDDAGKYKSGKRQSRNLLRVQVMPFHEEPQKIGHARRGDGASIWILLNELHPYVKWAMQQRDPVALRQIAATIFAADGVLKDDLQLRLPYDGLSEHERFVGVLSQALNLPEPKGEEGGDTSGRP